MHAFDRAKAKLSQPTKAAKQWVCTAAKTCVQRIPAVGLLLLPAHHRPAVSVPPEACGVAARELLHRREEGGCRTQQEEAGRSGRSAGVAAAQSGDAAAWQESVVTRQCTARHG